MLQSADKDLKTVIVNVQELKKVITEQKSDSAEKWKHNKEPHRNFRTEKYNNWNQEEMDPFMF